uniref:LRRCT domain-containing protein n=1 Tax=Glossina palpalis gambiensis TaxID=67801 RepID=A0A1B0BBJ1_9MUSC
MKNMRYLHAFKYFILFTILITLTKKSLENKLYKCPRFCKCDLYINLNRATCSAKHLVNAAVDVPSSVQILDLSYNDIRQVDEICFKNFHFLQYLNLSHNALHTISLETFNNLYLLYDLDLSYNRLEQLDERLFERNPHLFKLNLEGNKLMSLPARSMLRSFSLHSLNLRNSQLHFIDKEIFRNLPNLQVLDLSQNLLINLEVETFNALIGLKRLEINENPLQCNKKLQENIKQLQYKGIELSIDSCTVDEDTNLLHHVHKFEKIISPETVSNDQEEDSNEIDALQWRNYLNAVNEGSGFIFPEDDEEIKSETKLCDKQNDAKFAFLLGLVVGVTTALSMIVCALAITACFSKTTKVTDNLPETSNRRMNDRETLNPGHEQSAREITNANNRLSRSDRNRQRTVVRYDGPLHENFISRLFGRPARHQYYRSINRNTATLIRCLSRSNLLNNRLTNLPQPVEGRQTNYEVNREEDETNTQTQDFLSSESSASVSERQRPMTPPPPYKDVVLEDNGYRTE